MIPRLCTGTSHRVALYRPRTCMSLVFSYRAVGVVHGFQASSTTAYSTAMQSHTIFSSCIAQG
ncbi:hypothetical protein HBI56_041150 [Parastagonospora nodorum]|uniref:Uncharacterized protein n=1 Tax=Phaeosphaeria nodorum (strain SN15 / ATCC MYA-4574 / FGSC 10173) TaxID=321614 RepID=A0A7U2EUF1_PHANO|nr:hypothetical protein HBH56_065610 [Parastagonospora nodorum]QRC93280.1 hypothetical protein JI435_403520 [Parastagonospora nodorum SN15]KAH3932653.1 hypothetical protein HBH54_082480 [Parastagonospora nodorum]KAH3954796.1 hypothetical protein HBH53_011910 [Parastagonospora nodorum]KAH3986042.1 hypothetical protein HBH52_043110 [Parastagonospora nodorum]